MPRSSLSDLWQSRHSGAGQTQHGLARAGGLLPPATAAIIIPRMPDEPLAYFITIRTYGTWLSGDPRGSVDDQHRIVGEPFKQRNDLRAGFQQRHMRSPAFLITAEMRAVIESEIKRTCEFREWEMLALNVRTNHVHTVLSASIQPEAVMRELKVYTTRALRTAGLVSAQQSVWAAHGSTRYAWTDDEVAAVVGYTLDGQGDDLPGSAWRRQHQPD